VLLTGEDLNDATVAAAVEELGEQARRALAEPDAELSAVYELRYRGQAFELAIAAGVAPTREELRELFEAAHEERYGYRDADQELELVTVRVAATLPGAEPSLTAEGSPAPGDAEPETTRPATLGGETLELRVLRSPPPGSAISGPAVVELPEATLLVPPGWSGAVDDTGTIKLER
jgi:N-methylhydantoinase A